MSHGYLPAQFLSRLSNRRGDGSTARCDARMRFSVEVLEAVRAAAGGRMAVGARLSADERVPGGTRRHRRAPRSPPGCRRPAWSISSRSCSATPPSRRPRPGSPLPRRRRAAAIADPAAAIRAAVPGLTMLATTRLVDLEARRAAGRRRHRRSRRDDPGADRRSRARRQDASTARADEVIECVGCNQSCIGHYHAGVPIGCAVNARTGRERTLPARARPPAPGPRRRVLVIGGGPAGAAAAIEAARAGARSRSSSVQSELGGQLRLAGLAPAHAETWERYRRSTAARLRAAGVSVSSGSRPTRRAGRRL